MSGLLLAQVKLVPTMLTAIVAHWPESLRASFGRSLTMAVGIQGLIKYLLRTVLGVEKDTGEKLKAIFYGL